MTAKEKADMLYWKYYQLVADGSHPEEKAKECALNSVNETLSIVNNAYYHNGYYHDANALVSYLEHVKQEIQKL
jgi:hypothetical protein